MTDNTVLRLWGIGVPPYSARGLSESLEPIEQATQLRRTANGALKDLSASQFRKYRVTISGSDQQPPACDGVWAGQEVMVDCISELAFPEYGTPAKDVVDGSLRQEGDFMFYRPRLNMMVTSFNQSTDEWGASVSWQMVLEEV